MTRQLDSAVPACFTLAGMVTAAPGSATIISSATVNRSRPALERVGRVITDSQDVNKLSDEIKT